MKHLCQCGEVAYMRSQTATYLGLKQIKTIVEKHVHDREHVWPAILAVKECLLTVRVIIEAQVEAEKSPQSS
jgi:hypothetical protein